MGIVRGRLDTMLTPETDVVCWLSPKQKRKSKPGLRDFVSAVVQKMLKTAAGLVCLLDE